METQKVAGAGRRFLAYFIDSLILGMIGFGVGISVMAGSHGENSSGVSGLSFLLNGAYFVFFWVNQNGQTLGKRLMAIRVVREDGTPIDLGTAVVRYIGYLVSSIPLGLGFLWILWDKKKQGWHDKIAKTYVYETGEKPKTGLVVSLLVLFSLIIGALIIGFIAVIFLLIKEGPDKLPAQYKDQLSKIVPTMTIEDINTLANDTLNSINELRLKKNPQAKAIFLDNQLCAYAVRRVDSFVSRQGYDQGKGLYEDLADAQITKAYFGPGAKVGESFFEINEFSKGSEIASQMATAKNPSSMITDPLVTKGCIQIRGGYMVIVGSTD